MEPVSLTSACLALARLAFSTGNELHTLVSQCRDVPAVVRSLQSHLQIVNHCNTRLNGYLLQAPTSFTIEDKEHLDLSLRDCEVAINQIRQHIHSRKTSFSIFRRLKYVWNESLLKEAEHRLQRQLNLQQLLIQICQIPIQQRDSIRSHATTISVFAQARDSASTASPRAARSVPPSTAAQSEESRADDFRDDLANSPAYRSAFFSLMSRTAQPSSPQYPATSTLSTSSTVVGSATSPDRRQPFRGVVCSPALEGNEAVPSAALSPVLTDQSKRYSQQLGSFAYAGDIKKVRALLDNGADIEYLDDLKQSALTRAVLGHQRKVVRLLLERGAKPTLAEQQGHFLLHSAILGFNEASSNFAIAIELLFYNASVNILDSKGDAPLHCLIGLRYMMENKAIMKRIMELGGQIDIRNNQGFTPLHKCASLNDTDMARILVQAGADLESRVQLSTDRAPNAPGEALELEGTALHIAADGGNLHVVRLLLSLGAVVDSCTESRITPLYLVFQRLGNIWLDFDKRCATLGGDYYYWDQWFRQYHEIVELLHRHGASFSHVNGVHEVGRSKSLRRFFQAYGTDHLTWEMYRDRVTSLK